jgi:predicted helicase
MSKAKIYYARVDEFWRKEQKYIFLEETQHKNNIEWQEIQPDRKQTWLTEGMSDEFETFIQIGSKEAKSASSKEAKSIFKTYSLGVSTNRDSVVYGFDKDKLSSRVKQFCDDYNAEVFRYQQKGKPIDIDSFLKYDRIKWSRNLKRDLKNQKALTFEETSIRVGLYRPFTKEHLYFADIIVDESGANIYYFPNTDSEEVNQLIWLKVGTEVPVFALVVNKIPNLLPQGGSQCFPFYTYDEDGTNRKENITDWALDEFRNHYKDSAITKWDIFHYVYALLHHPTYRERYAANLKRELPRIPFAPDFPSFARAGERLAELHVDYEQQAEFPLEMIESAEASLDWRVERMRLSKDKTKIIYNDFLTLAGIPPLAFEYRLGNRSALEWVIDQYQVTTDKRSGITNDPNREDDPQYIVRLVGQVITVSLETVEIVRSLPELGVATGAWAGKVRARQK